MKQVPTPILLPELPDPTAGADRGALRKPGALKGRGWIADDFDDEDPALTAMFESDA